VVEWLEVILLLVLFALPFSVFLLRAPNLKIRLIRSVIASFVMTLVVFYFSEYHVSASPENKITINARKHLLGGANSALYLVQAVVAVCLLVAPIIAFLFPSQSVALRIRRATFIVIITLWIFFLTIFGTIITSARYAGLQLEKIKEGGHMPF